MCCDMSSFLILVIYHTRIPTTFTHTPSIIVCVVLQMIIHCCPGESFVQAKEETSWSFGARSGASKETTTRTTKASSWLCHRMTYIRCAVSVVASFIPINVNNIISIPPKFIENMFPLGKSHFPKSRIYMLDFS